MQVFAREPVGSVKGADPAPNLTFLALQPLGFGFVRRELLQICLNQSGDRRIAPSRRDTGTGVSLIINRDCDVAHTFTVSQQRADERLFTGDRASGKDYRSYRGTGRTYYGHDEAAGAPKDGSQDTATARTVTSGSNYAKSGGFKDSKYASKSGSYRDSRFATPVASDPNADHSPKHFGSAVEALSRISIRPAGHRRRGRRSALPRGGDSAGIRLSGAGPWPAHSAAPD